MEKELQWRYYRKDILIRMELILEYLRISY